MRVIVFSLAAALALSGCQEFMDSTQRAGYGMRREITKTSNRISDYFRVEENRPEPQRRTMAPRYCYRVLTDIVCYRDPQPGAENRLVGYYEPPAGGDSAASAQDGYLLPPEQQVHVKPVAPVGQKSSPQAENPQPLM